MRIARVFPRKTKATPKDELCFYDVPPMLCLPEIDEIHISVTFTYDKLIAEYLAEQWKYVGVPMKIGGPAYGQRKGNFIPGLYIRKPYVITSRGCNNNCWYCKVPKGIEELPIEEGSIVQDDNLLLCSDDHIKSVFLMLKKQKDRPSFPGGLEAKLLKTWHVELLNEVKTKEMFFAYDTPDDLEPLIEAGKILSKYNFTLKSRKVYAYVLIGYKSDTFEKAERRLKDTLKAGFIPYAMLYKNDNGDEDHKWRSFQRSWLRPAAIVSSNKEFFS